MTRQQLGERLRYWREVSGFTQEEVGRYTGLDQYWISHIETGKRYPSVENLYKIVLCLGIEAEIFQPFSEQEESYDTATVYGTAD